ncbi:hypothetical protein [Kaistella antarctica]|uniref:Uncharacterized protein n=1 Tax=Kaistella antarctica TaxID=266748 RepID=A0A448NRC8_9FLAO|nr:hypothetical protein [Kaistella antarctica]KEY18853.1 hypothetical protein HY04_10305 [Kaistella antarctica]SEW14680.1 hypothetical protein SAMN05421765_2673 [Kaistella antarctica]VEH99364.1 Uncharacterised protein [Kaistella antarctica]
MNNKKPAHNFHIPVMGLAYTIDSPIRVAQYGISSVISIIDDEIIEKMNSLYHKRNNFSYTEISNKIEDYRAKRITAYLDMVHDVVNVKFENFKQELSKSKEALNEYIEMLPNKSDLKKGLENLADQKENFTENVRNFLESHLSPGSIDVNVMTKVDKDNFVKGEQLPVMFNDAHVSLRGFANSKLSSSIVLSAGMNPRLYSYFESFPDFFPNEKGELKKKIILKVSDFRSAMIQGNFLAKKGLWVSEYRVESGLNCGGHAFATDGLLLGPIMEEFKQKKNDLISSAHELMVNALTQKEIPVPAEPLEMKITVQGGVGTAEEHEFLLENYKVDSIGWGSPFLLVPEATSVDKETRELLSKSKEEDFYLSNISPLGIPFNTVKGSTNEFFKQDKINRDRAGSSCPKKYLALSKEFSPEGICTASRKYQTVKLNDLEEVKEEITLKEYDKRKNKIQEKSCLCVGLVNSSYLESEIPVKGEKQGVVVCPGPNLAYFDKEVSLSTMVKHIYGNENVMHVNERPNIFVNELKMYVDHLKNEIEEFSDGFTNAQSKKWRTFKSNLIEGVNYYEQLFAETSFFKNNLKVVQVQLADYKSSISDIEIPENVKA